MTRFLASFMALMLTATLALAEATILSAPEAQKRLEAGELILLDIRTPGEWAETGVAQGAWPVSMHVEGFGERLQTILAQYPPEQVALICAVGGRSNHVASILERNGITGIVDVSEGMIGNDKGAGWIARGLPVVSAETARAAYEAAISN